MVKLFANSRNLDQMPLHSAASDLGLLCLPVTLLDVSRLKWVRYIVKWSFNCQISTQLGYPDKKGQLPVIGESMCTKYWLSRHDLNSIDWAIKLQINPNFTFSLIQVSRDSCGVNLWGHQTRWISWFFHGCCVWPSVAGTRHHGKMKRMLIREKKGKMLTGMNLLTH